MMSYPLSFDETEGESLKIGFSKAVMNRKVRGIKKAIGLALAGIFGFVIIVFAMARVRSPKKARAL